MRTGSVCLMASGEACAAPTTEVGWLAAAQVRSRPTAVPPLGAARVEGRGGRRVPTANLPGKSP